MLDAVSYYRTEKHGSFGDIFRHTGTSSPGNGTIAVAIQTWKPLMQLSGVFAITKTQDDTLLRLSLDNVSL